MTTLTLYAAAILFGTVHSYHIGNSLSRDGYGVRGNPKTLEAIAYYQGHDLDLGYHFSSAHTLPAIWDKQGAYSGVGEPYGNFINALPNYEFDHITLQPYSRAGSTFGNDKRAITGFIDLARQNPANHDSTFYIYQVWSEFYVGNYATYWDTPVSGSDSMYTTNQRGYYNSLMEWADTVYKPQGIKVRQIPIGEVYYRLWLMSEAGELPIRFRDLYRDKIHASTDVGKYILSATMFSTMFQEEITEVLPLDFYFNPSVLTPEIATLINRTVWEVVSTDPYAGIFNPGTNTNPVGDLNNDHFVDAGDFALWQEGYSLNASGDADKDGDTDGRDFLILQRNYRPAEVSPGPLSTSLAVPEPSSVVLLLGTVIAVSSCRYCG